MVGIDTNILIYACDKGSPFHEEAKALVRSMLNKDGIAISDLSLLEFFSVVTDGIKVTNPLSVEEALKLIENIWSAEEFCVCTGNTEVIKKTFRCAAKLNILRYGINDVYIAMSLAEKGFQSILTRNTKDFKKFNFIQAINPFKETGILQPETRNGFIPYGRQSIDEKDVAAVCSALRSDWLTTGPKVKEFEQALADYLGAKYAIAVSSGTAALHAAVFALSIGPGDEVIVPPMTFAATANCVVYQGGTPVFADVDPDTLLLDPEQVEAKITDNTKAIIGVDYAGQPCDWDALREIADRHNLHLVDDGCHALGAEYKGKKVGTLVDLTAFSFHPVKHITTGEGGMITTDNEEYAEKMRLFRTHGITRDPKQFVFSEEVSPSSTLCSMPFYYQMTDIGYNYRITDIQCALGLSQLQKLPEFLHRRREIAARYDVALADIPGIKPLGLRSDVQAASQSSKLRAQSEGKEGAASDPTPRSTFPAPYSLHAYHLYAVRIPGQRGRVFTEMQQLGIGVNVHYIPVHLHPYYQKCLATGSGFCPNAERAYEEIVSLPIYPDLSDDELERVLETLRGIVELIDIPV